MTTSNYQQAALRLSVLDDRLAVCRLAPDSEMPGWATKAGFFSVTCTPDELSIVCPEPYVPDEVTCERGWRALVVEGPLDFSLVGVLASLLEPLAEAGISVFAVSTYDTDYVLVREEALEDAISALGARHEVRYENLILRPAAAEDEPFLWKMLYESVHWGPEETGPKPPPEELISAESVLRRHLEGWGRENDFAIIALDAEHENRIGAAWYRTFSVQEPGYGFVEEPIPAIAIAVAPERRGMGVGGALLQALMSAACSEGFEALSLSVQKSNQTAVKLYEKKGFVTLREDEEERIMKVELSTEEISEARSALRTEEKCR